MPVRVSLAGVPTSCGGGIAPPLATQLPVAGRGVRRQRHVRNQHPFQRDPGMMIATARCRAFRDMHEIRAVLGLIGTDIQRRGGRNSKGGDLAGGR